MTNQNDLVRMLREAKKALWGLLTMPEFGCCEGSDQHVASVRANAKKAAHEVVEIIKAADLTEPKPIYQATQKTPKETLSPCASCHTLADCYEKGQCDHHGYALKTACDADEKITADNQICRHGGNAWIDDCGMCDAANVQAEEVPAHLERILGMPPERRLIRLLKGLHQRFPDVDTKGFMNAPDSGYLDAIDAILKPAHLVQGDAELSRKLTYSLIKLMVGSCDCGVKSHEVHFHYENCMFRFYSELYEFIESTGKHRQPPASVSQIGYIRVGDIERIQR